jgi:hypothetical protein
MINDFDNSVCDSWAGDDYRAVMRHVAEGTPVEPELARRVRERAERITEEIRHEHGDIDVVSLLHEAREET